MAAKNQKPVISNPENTSDAEKPNVESTEVAPKVAKKLTKAEQMAGFKAYMAPLAELTLVPNLGDLEIYVKSTTLNGYYQKLDQLRALKDKHGAALLDERSLALELFDETGAYYFDLDDEEQMQFLKDMPFAARQKLSSAIGTVNGGFDIPKTLLTTESD
ncbi:hypothetical protein ADP71_31790 [Vitreoscilla sp. C1]|uniref:hypothetical protein n=1 Tax=Vitreoscilla sp. (strain C1) TaxID=96942 RepID=UPI00148EDF59|nr:hypothetical protein [Vitreoscilla sp. C1]AUZ06357.2 hypothetical protein ADP71_31790 [Vitreoscilla sp. C1]